MELDYAEIGKRIARRRKELGLKQTEVCERAGINDKYLSCIVLNFYPSGTVLKQSNRAVILMTLHQQLI